MNKYKIMSQIEYVEDKLLRSKDDRERMRLKGELGELRSKLQKIQWNNYKEHES